MLASFHVVIYIGLDDAFKGLLLTSKSSAQVHKRTSNIQTIGQDVELIYGKFAPFQYLVYWYVK